MIKKIVKISILLIVVLGLFLGFSSKPKVNVYESKNHTYALGNNDSSRMYILYNNELKKNVYTKDNPYIMALGEEISFKALFGEEEYNDAKLTIGSTVYDNDIKQGYNTIHVLERKLYDTWKDDEKTLNFGFRAVNVGLVEVSIYMKSEWGTSEELLYVRVVKPDTVYFFDKMSGECVETIGYLDVDKGGSVQLIALLTGNLAMNGDVPSIEAYTGSGFYTFDGLPIDNKWERFGNNWLVSVLCSPTQNKIFTVSLAKNGAANISNIKLVSKQNDIHLNNIKIGDKKYNDIDKNTATRMLNGNVYNNVDSNRYPVFVGKDVELYVENKSGLKFSLANSNTMNQVDSRVEDNKLKVTFKALKPGNNDIILKDGSGNVLETFYVVIKYPIYVNTSLGEYSKDNIHEYVHTGLEYVYVADKSMFITNDQNYPIYVKNGNGTNYFYYMFKDNTVVLSTYVNKNDTNNFVLGNGLEIVSNDAVELTGEMEGFKRIVTVIKVTKDSGETNVKFGGETFYISVKNKNEKSNHSDFEINDNGTYTIVNNYNDKDGAKVIEQLTYNVFVSKVYNSKMYDKNGNLLGVINENEYWKSSNPKGTQYEITSAYATNEYGNLIGKSGVNIDDYFRSGFAEPVVKTRDLVMNDIKSAVFLLDMHLVPAEKTTVRITTDKNGNEVISTPVVEDFVDKEFDLKNFEVKLDERDILDAINRCPSHQGMDFTTRISLHVDKKFGNLKVSKLLEHVDDDNKDTSFTFKVTLKDVDGNIAKDVNGVKGDVVFDEGIATFDLKNKTDIMIMNIPAGLNYLVEEVDSKGYKPYAVNDSNVIVADQTLNVKFVNSKNDASPSTGSFLSVPIILGLAILTTVTYKKYKKMKI